MDKETRESIESTTPLGMALDWAMIAQNVFGNRETYGDDDAWDRAMFHTAGMAAVWGEIAGAAVNDHPAGTTVGELMRTNNCKSAQTVTEAPKTDNVALIWPTRTNTERLRCDKHGLLLVEHQEDGFHDGTWRLDSPR